MTLTCILADTTWSLHLKLETIATFPQRLNRIRLILVSIVIVVVQSGCSALPYYTQAIQGQVAIWRAEVPLQDAIADRNLDPQLRENLALIAEARDFAYQHLGFPDNGSYRSFANLEREYVVWNVVVAPVFALEPKQSCFLFAGCFSYRGYFDEAAARAFAANEQRLGNDIYVGGVSAYSTVGWFKDPVLSTMLQTRPEQFIETLFHELAHEWFYLKDDTSFNESYAVVVAEHSLAEWNKWREISTKSFDAWSRLQALLEIIAVARSKLIGIYSSATPAEQMAVEKEQVFHELKEDYLTLKQEWSGYDGFDAWMLEPWNNAKLAAVATYQDWVPFMRRLLDQANHDLPRFRQLIADLAAISQENRRACLIEFSRGRQQANCPGNFRLNPAKTIPPPT